MATITQMGMTGEYSPEDVENGWAWSEAVRGVREVNALERIIAGKAFIAGGYAAWCASRCRSPKPPGDIDVWLYNEGSFEDVVASLVAAGLELSSRNEFGQRFKASTAHPWDVLPGTIQVIAPREEGRLKTFGRPEDLISRFDFTVCRAYLMGATVVHDPDLLEDQRRRVLRIKNIVCPISSIGRCVKYGRKGYRLPVLEIFRILREWDARRDEYSADTAELDEMLERSGVTKEEWAEWYGTETARRIGRFD